MGQIVVVDCQNDFISGTLACTNGDAAVDYIKGYINSNHGIEVFYTADFHPEDHMSFVAQGGQWPPHCVANTVGAEISEVFQEMSESRPSVNNIYYKGRIVELEEYSAIDATSESGVKMLDLLDDEVIVAGIASEFCVRETVLDLMANGKKVKVLRDGLAYVDESNHLGNLSELEEMGVTLI